LAHLRHRFASAWRKLPPGAFARWGAVLAGGFVACAALSVAITRLGQYLHPRGMQAWDERWLLWSESSGVMSFSNAILIESFGNLAFMIPLTLLGAAWMIHRRRPLAALSFIAAYVLERPLYMIGWMLWERARPQLIAGGIAAPPFHSYPSGHVALMAAGYGFIAYLWMRGSGSRIERMAAGVLLLALLAMVGLARIRLGTHWPSDILAGMVLGLAWAGVVAMALRRAEAAGGR
jgi:undecaprenyl-diphosphatase